MELHEKRSAESVKGKYHITNREISWLQFNARVLQEAADTRNPLYERIKFLAIYSSNLDEFFRVRIASLRSLTTDKKIGGKKLPFDPDKLLRKIQNIVAHQQERFEYLYSDVILPELAQHQIAIVNETALTPEQETFAREYFRTKVQPHLHPYLISKQNKQPFIQLRSQYLVVQLHPKKQDIAPTAQGVTYALVEIPASELGRFLTLPKHGKMHSIILLDDVIRLSLREYFPLYDVGASYAVKLVRDAELHIDDEFQGNLLDKIQLALRNRKRGIPCRFLYDRSMPADCLSALVKFFRLQQDDLSSGGRYFNFGDFFAFPNPLSPALENKPLPPLNIPVLDEAKKLYRVIRDRDVLLQYPYTSFDYVIRFLNEAAADPAVTTIKITLYRVADRSRVVEALKTAAKNGKDVTAFVELKARFNEESNLFWAGELELAGVNVLYSFPGLKVHGKLCIVTRIENNEKKRYTYLATGNFNEKTAALYTDFGLFTANQEITKEVNEVFKILARKESKIQFKHLLVAPYAMRNELDRMIDTEISAAKVNKKAYIILKLNNLEDPALIQKLYQASRAGVRIQLITRSVCSAIPGVNKYSKNIRAVSIVDRFLEHSRVIIFCNGGNERIFLASADWMVRSMDHRIEVAFPVYDESLKDEIRKTIALQLADNQKARIIAKGKMNLYRRNRAEPIRSQIEIYKYYKKLYSPSK